MESTGFVPARTAPSGQLIPAALGVAGGLIAVAGAILAWETVTLNDALAAFWTESTSQAGIEGNGGKIILVLGAVAIVLAAAPLLKIRIPSSAQSLLVVVGAAIVGVALLNWGRIQDDIGQFNNALSVLKGTVSLDGVSANVGIGVLLDVVGGIVIAVGGVLPFVLRRR